MESELKIDPPLIVETQNCAVSIGIMGTPVSSGNRGVLALGASLVQLCQESSLGATVYLVGSHRGTEPVEMWIQESFIKIPIVRWRLSLRAPWREHLILITLASLLYRFSTKLARKRLESSIPWIGQITRMSWVGDVRGGDSFSDIYGLKRFLLATLPVLSVIWIRGGIVLFPQTYGPFKSSIARRVARFIMTRATTIIARDHTSLKVAQEIAGPAKPVQFSPDVAFALHARMPTNIQLYPPGRNATPDGCVGINVNGLMLNGGYTGANMFGLKLEYGFFLKQLVHQMLSLQDRDVWLVPHTFAPAGDPESDNDACLQLWQSLPAVEQARVKIIIGEYDAHELKGIIGRFDFFVGSRMHSCIAALSQGVPCVGVAYSMKFSGVFDSVGARHWIVDARELDLPSALDQVKMLHAQRNSFRPKLLQQAHESRAALRLAFTNLINQESDRLARSKD